MMRVDVVSLPAELEPRHLKGRAVVVFDVLRATTTMAAALGAGASEICIFGSLDEARRAAEADLSPRILAGEAKCLPPPGFDLGNSPGDFTAERVAGKRIYLCTTNGTRALVAARGAERLFAAALVNAGATARFLGATGRDVTLLCAGTNGEHAPEDLIGAGAVIDALERSGRFDGSPKTDEARELFHNSRSRLGQALRSTAGGINVLNAGLERDIDFSARIDALDVVVEVGGDPPIARRMIGPC